MGRRTRPLPAPAVVAATGCSVVSLGRMNDGWLLVACCVVRWTDEERDVHTNIRKINERLKMRKSNEQKLEINQGGLCLSSLNHVLLSLFCQLSRYMVYAICGFDSLESESTTSHRITPRISRAPSCMYNVLCKYCFLGISSWYDIRSSNKSLRPQSRRSHARAKLLLYPQYPPSQTTPCFSPFNQTNLPPTNIYFT